MTVAEALLPVSETHPGFLQSLAEHEVDKEPVVAPMAEQVHLHQVAFAVAVCLVAECSQTTTQDQIVTECSGSLHHCQGQPCPAELLTALSGVLARLIRPWPR